MWTEKLENLLIDVAKYVITGVILTTFWGDIHNKVVLYVGALLFIAICLYGSLLLHKKFNKK